MDEFKHKLLSLINKQGSDGSGNNIKIPLMGFSELNHQLSTTTTVKNQEKPTNNPILMSINSKTVSELNRPSDQDILESIEAAYFSIDPNYDICRYELSKLQQYEQLDCMKIQGIFKNLKQQHQVVSKKVLQLILEHQQQCFDEFKNIKTILDEIKKTLKICRDSRRNLSIIDLQYRQLLLILNNYRKRRLLDRLLNYLKIIRQLYNFDCRIERYIKTEDYSNLIIELKQLEMMAIRYKEFNCIAILLGKFEEILENTDGQLETVLIKICYKFDREQYERLIRAYNLLEKSEITIIDNLHVNYITAIYNSSIRTVGRYVRLAKSLNLLENNRNQYKILCQNIDQRVFIACLLDLCKVLFKIIRSYHQLIKYHQFADNDGDNRRISDEYQLKLGQNLVKIWDDVQRKVSNLLINVNLNKLKFDEFVQILLIINRLILIGDEFCSSKSIDLQQSIKQQSINYFFNYHQLCLDELRIFLENEIWESLPIKSNFNLLKLHEFRYLRRELKNFQQTYQSTTTNSDYCSSIHSQDSCCNFFIKYQNDITPFDDLIDINSMIIIDNDEDILVDDHDDYSNDSDDDVDDIIVEDIDDDNVDNNRRFNKNNKNLNNNNNKKQELIVTNTMLSILRQIGKYLHMSKLLQPISYQIITCMNQLFDYYLYSIHLFFTSDLTVSSSSLYSTELTITLKKIQDTLILDDNTTNKSNIDGDNASDNIDIVIDNNTNNDDDFSINNCNSNSNINNNTISNNDSRVQKPNLSILVNLNQNDTLFGLTERIIATESLIFLSKQYQYLHDYLESLIPQTNKIMLQQFFSQNIASAVDLRKPIYMSVVARIFDLRQILSQITKINWEVRDVMSQHNNYIDIILREIQLFKLRLNELIEEKLILDDIVYNTIWECIAHIITHTLVQGFSEAKRCSNGGRALMQLDFTQFLIKFEKISKLRPIPHREYVENYIKAYYLPEMELEKWIREHNEYSSKHLYGLVCCACQNNKKTKQRLLQIIEDNEKQHDNR